VRGTRRLHLADPIYKSSVLFSYKYAATASTDFSSGKGRVCLSTPISSTIFMRYICLATCERFERVGRLDYTDVTIPRHVAAGNQRVVGFT
jgi:hypothetical protein